jgi:hypothetical protein
MLSCGCYYQWFEKWNHIVQRTPRLYWENGNIASVSAGLHGAYGELVRAQVSRGKCGERMNCLYMSPTHLPVLLQEFTSCTSKNGAPVGILSADMGTRFRLLEQLRADLHVPPPPPCRTWLNFRDGFRDPRPDP